MAMQSIMEAFKLYRYNIINHFVNLVLELVNMVIVDFVAIQNTSKLQRVKSA